MASGRDRRIAERGMDAASRSGNSGLRILPAPVWSYRMSNLESLAQQFRLIPTRMQDAIREGKSNSAGEAGAIAGSLLVQAIEAGLFSEKPELLLAVQGAMANETEGSKHARAYCRAAKVLLDRPQGKTTDLVADGCPVIADAIDRLVLARRVVAVARDKLGYLLTGIDAERSGRWPLRDRTPCPLETTIPRVLAAGDVRAGSTKRVGFAVGDGSLAVTCTHRLRTLRV